MVLATWKTVVAARALRVLDVQFKRRISFLQRSTLLVWRCLTSVRALSAERVRLEEGRMEWDVTVLEVSVGASSLSAESLEAFPGPAPCRTPIIH